jgi:hypothetical protein
MVTLARAVGFRTCEFRQDELGGWAPDNIPSLFISVYSISQSISKNIMAVKKVGFQFQAKLQILFLPNENRS